MACQKTDVIRSVHRLCRADKRKRKQNTVYISDKHRRVEYRLSCVCLKRHGHGEERTGLNVCVFG